VRQPPSWPTNGTHNASGPGKLAALLTIILYCLGVFTAIFAGLYVRRTTQEWSSFWELKSYPEIRESSSSSSSCSFSIYWASAPRKEPIFLAIILFR